MKKLFTLAAGLAITATAFAQTPVPPAPPAQPAKNTTINTDDVKPFEPASSYRTWSVGVNGGILSPWTIIDGKRDYRDPKLKIGYGGFIKKQLTPGFGIQADFLRGILTAMMLRLITAQVQIAHSIQN